MASGGIAVEVEVDVHVLAEAAGVVVDGRAGVAERLHQAVDQQDLLLERPIIGLNQNIMRP